MCRLLRQNRPLSCLLASTAFPSHQFFSAALPAHPSSVPASLERHLPESALTLTYGSESRNTVNTWHGKDLACFTGRPKSITLDLFNHTILILRPQWTVTRQ